MRNRLDVTALMVIAIALKLAKQLLVIGYWLLVIGCWSDEFK